MIYQINYFNLQIFTFCSIALIKLILTCNAPCFTCQPGNNSSCVSCDGSLYLLGSSCVDVASCGAGKFANTLNNQCDNCSVNCEECIDTADKCTKCSSFLLDPPTNTCTSTCSNGYYPVTASKECVQCHNNCATCSGPSNTECFLCNSTFFHDGNPNECITCPVGKYGNTSTGNCTPCHANCAECFGGSENECTKCKDGFYHNKELSNPYLCSTNCYQSDVCGVENSVPCKGTPDNQCVSCYSSCLTCVSESMTDCRSCLADPNDGIQDFYLYNTQCIAACPSHMYPDAQAVCQTCSGTCATCVTSPGNCTSCPNGSFLDQNTCGISCITENTYPESFTNKCELCDSTCKTCDGPSDDECLSCSVGRYWQNSTLCLSTCYPKFFGDTADNVCKSCNSECKTCSTSASTCTSCENGWYLHGSQCLTSCPVLPNLVQVGAPLNACVDPNCTDPNCTQCNYDFKSNCFQCTNNTYLLNVTCVTECGSGYYENTNNNKCTACDTGCSLCDIQPYICQGCNDGYFLDSNLNFCSTSCTGSQYEIGPPTNACVSCNTACTSCTGPNFNQCSQCASGYFLEGTSCVQQCTSGFYGSSSDNTCKPCLSPCVTCQGNSYTCLSCIDGRFLHNVSCMTNCPTGIAQIGPPDNLCGACHSTCLECDGVNFNDCTKCSTGSSIGPFLLNGECIHPCPQGYYASIAIGTCELCHFKCTICYNAQETTCQKCSLGFYLQKQTCVVDCDLEYYKDENSQQCLKCHSSCKLCSSGGQYGCTECNLERIFNLGACRLCSEFNGMITSPDYEDGNQLKCIPNCGDGKKIEGENCDDGNNIDGDGCSSTCQLEPNSIYKCEGGDVNNPDICYDSRPIGYTIQLIQNIYYNYDQHSDFAFILEFNKTISLPSGQNLTSYMEVGFYDKDKEKTDYYPFILSDFESQDRLRNLIVAQKQQFNILVQVNQIIKNRSVKVKFNNIEQITDGFGQGLAFDSLVGEQEVKLFVPYNESQRSNSNLYTFLMLPAIVIIIVLSYYAFIRYHNFKNNFYIMFLSLDLLQITYFYRFINIRWPLNLYDYFNNLEHFTNFFMFNMFKSIEVEESQKNSGFEAFDRQNKSLLLFENIGGLFLYFAILLVIMFILHILARDQQQQNFKCQPFFQKIYTGYFKLSVWVDFFLASVGVFFSFSFFQLVSFDRAGDYLFSIIFILSIIGITAFCTRFIKKNQENLYFISQETQLQHIEDISQNNPTFKLKNLWIHTVGEKEPFKVYITTFLIIRKLQLPLFLLAFQSLPNVQIISQLTFHVVYILILVKQRNFKDPKDNIRVMICEVFTAIGLGMCINLVDDSGEDEDFRLNYGWFVQMMFTISLIVNSVYVTIQIVVLPLLKAHQQKTKVENVDLQVQDSGLVNLNQRSSIYQKRQSGMILNIPGAKYRQSMKGSNQMELEQYQYNKRNTINTGQGRKSLQPRVSLSSANLFGIQTNQNQQQRQSQMQNISNINKSSYVFDKQDTNYQQSTDRKFEIDSLQDMEQSDYLGKNPYQGSQNYLQQSPSKINSQSQSPYKKRESRKSLSPQKSRKSVKLGNGLNFQIKDLNNSQQSYPNLSMGTGSYNNIGSDFDEQQKKRLSKLKTGNEEAIDRGKRNGSLYLQPDSNKGNDLRKSILQEYSMKKNSLIFDQQPKLGLNSLSKDPNQPRRSRKYDVIN